MSFLNVGASARDCNGTVLKFDQACLEVSSTKHVQFLMQSAGCEGCELKLAAEVKANATQELALSTLWPVHWKVRDPDAGRDICNETTTEFGELGRYALNTSCSLRMTAEPDAAYLPLLETAVVLLALATLWYLVKAALRRLGRMPWYWSRDDNELGEDTRPLTVDPVPRSRLRSLDVFRGASVALMIFVNCGGGGYAVLRHAPWNGLTLADLVFPCFAWVMGASLVLSLSARLRTGTSRATALSQVARRSLALALIGVVLGSRDAGLDSVRLPGVLQRLAACYLLVAALECAFMQAVHSVVPGRSLTRDLVAGWKQWLVTIALVSVQVCVSLLAAAPGCPRGYLGPGGLHLSRDHMNLTNCTGGIAGYIDRQVFGDGHLYRGGAFRQLYAAWTPFDPEGLLGILSAILVVQAGAHSSRIMLHYNHARARVMRLVGWGALLALAGGALCGFSQEGGVLPLNKSLWSLSYCLLTAGIAFLLQAVLYFVVDLKAKWGGRPLYYAGQNALALYICSELLRQHFPLHWPLRAPTHAALLASHAATTLAFLALGVALQRKRIFISL